MLRKYFSELIISYGYYIRRSGLLLDLECCHHLGLGQVDIMGMRAAADQHVILDAVIRRTE